MSSRELTTVRMSNKEMQSYKLGRVPFLHVFKLIILKCVVGAGDGLCHCRSTEGSVEQRCTAVITPCQVKFAASCAGPSPQVIARICRVACLGYRTRPSLNK